MDNCNKWKVKLVDKDGKTRTKDKMVLSRAQQQIAFAHVVNTVFGFSDQDHQLHKALKQEGIDKVTDLLTLSSEDIDDLAFTEFQ